MHSNVEERRFFGAGAGMDGCKFSDSWVHVLQMTDISCVHVPRNVGYIFRDCQVCDSLLTHEYSIWYTLYL